jgi:hypothetical protein
MLETLLPSLLAASLQSWILGIIEGRAESCGQIVIVDFDDP